MFPGHLIYDSCFDFGDGTFSVTFDSVLYKMVSCYEAAGSVFNKMSLS